MTDAPNALPGVLESIREHARSGGDGPVGGILIGWVEGDGVTVERAVATDEAEAHSGELVFTPPCWDLAYAELESVGAESRIIGWYHASPNHGAELSAYDRSLHRTLFPDPTHVALVLDPGSDDLAWFGWEVERIAPLLPEVDREAAPATEAVAVGAGAAVAGGEAARARSAGRLGAGLLALVVLGAVAVGAFLWGNATTETRVVTRTQPTSDGAAAQQLVEAKAEAGRLREQLAQEGVRLAALREELEETKAALVEARKQPKPTKKEPFVFLYQIRPGDTMFTLAQTFYGTGDAWAKIWRANPSPDPNHIEAGAWLKIPLQNPN